MENKIQGYIWNMSGEDNLIFFDRLTHPENQEIIYFDFTKTLMPSSVVYSTLNWGNVA